MRGIQLEGIYQKPTNAPHPDFDFSRIGKPERELESGEAPWISTDQFTGILDCIVAHPDHDRLAITFDDGNISDLAIATPRLLRRGLGATFFVLTGRIGRSGSLSTADIAQLMASGMSIGSHGVSHRDWTGLTTTELEYELVGSKTALQEICGHPPCVVAIPFGRYNAAVLRALQTAGYQAAYSSDRGSANATAFLRSRTSVRNDTTQAELDQILLAILPPLRRLRRTAAIAVKNLV